MDNGLLQIENLKVAFETPAGQALAVDGVNLTINRGETVALLGESGCGKTMTAMAVQQLLPPNAKVSTHSHVKLDGMSLFELSEVKLRYIRGRKMATIFQEPMTSLNPVMTIGYQIGEVLRAHFGLKGRTLNQRILELLESVSIPEADRRIHEYPHQLSGGMKQRVMIAMALAGEPELLIADEPTTALDVTIQKQVLELIKAKQEQTGMAMLLITHDLGIVREMADQVAVMYAGQIVEKVDVETLYTQPKHPYTEKLFDSLPTLAKRHERLAVIQGFVPALAERLPACQFASRCPYAGDVCHTVIPQLLQSHLTKGATAASNSHQVRCHRYDDRYNDQLQQVSHDSVTPLKVSYQSHEGVLLKVNHLKVHFPIKQGLLKSTRGYVKAVDGVSFEIPKGKTIALVGESGCGKTTTGRAILQLIQSTAGDVVYQGKLLGDLSRRELKQTRRELQIIFQDPFSSMNPRMLVQDIIAEGMLAHRIYLDNQQREQRVIELLMQVGLPAESRFRYPHEFSGGQRQRICIARALAVEPKLIVCDEPTSALDVSVQAQIINLLKDLQNQYGLSYLFITHNMSVVGYLADEVLVMYQGKIVERGPTEQILTNPQHEYTQQLLAAVPKAA